MQFLSFYFLYKNTLHYYHNFKYSSNKYYVHSQWLIYMMTARLCLADIHEIQSDVAD